MVNERGFDFKKRLYFTVGVAAIATVVLFGVNFFLMGKLDYTTRQIQEKRKTIFFRSKVIERETLLKTDLARAQREIAFLDNVLPALDNLLDFPKDISVWSNQNNLDVGFSFIKETKGISAQEPSSISFILTGLGDLSSIFNFIKIMENSRYLIQFNQYDIVSEGKNYTLLINGQIFSR